MAPLKKKRIQIRKFPVTQYQADALKQLCPPENITVSEWAENYRVLDSKTSALPGPWRNEKTPYLKEIMDELINYDTERIIFVKPTQVGGTEALQNMLGYVIQQDPSPTMIVYPTDILAKSISENRLEPMVMATRTLKSLYNKNESSQLELQFDGMYLSLAGSNSPSSLASKAIKYLFLDEVDKYPGSSKKESDPISLAMERTKTFRNRKIYMTSTPTLATGHIWKALMDADIEKHYFIPCPHCGSMIELTFQNLKFPSGDDLSNQDRADMAVYRCQECGGDITDQDKEQMLRYGEWKTVRENSKYNRKVGFWINTLYSPFVRFSEIVKEFLDREYAEQVTAEHKVNVKSGNRTVQRWVPKRSHIDNHYLDAEVYALAAADISGVRTLHLQDEAEAKAKAERPEEAYAPEETWIKQNENWI